MITFIVQGPLNNNLAKSLPIYQKYGNIILSCWDSDPVKYLSEIGSNVKYTLVTRPYPHKEEIDNISSIISKDHHGGILYQMLTIINALSFIKKSSSQQQERDYIIKVRSDEYFENLDTFIHSLYEGKFVSGNMFCLHSMYWKYHISDQIFGCDADDFRGMFNQINDILNTLFSKKEQQPIKLKEYIEYISEQVDCIHPEQMIAISYCVQKGIQPSTNYENIMRDNFSIVSMKSMGKFVVSYKNPDNLRLYVSDTNNEYLWINSISEMLELPRSYPQKFIDQEDMMFHFAIGKLLYCRGEW